MPASTRPPVALVVTGPPAAGKTTLGRALATHLGAALLDQDTATAPLTAVVAELVGVHDLDDDRLALRTRAARYETVSALAEDNLRAGIPVVLVAPFSLERRDAQAWTLLAQRLQAAGGAPVLVWLRLDPADVVARLRARAAGRDAEKLADPAAFIRTLDLAAPLVPHLAVDAAAPVAEVVGDVLAALTR